MVNDNVLGSTKPALMGNLVSNNNLNGNVFGICLDGHPEINFRITALGMKNAGGGTASLGDGICLFSSNANYVTHCELSNKQTLGYLCST